jgi:hypothetical protein
MLTAGIVTATVAFASGMSLQPVAPAPAGRRLSRAKGERIMRKSAPLGPKPCSGRSPGLSVSGLASRLCGS